MDIKGCLKLMLAYEIIISHSVLEEEGSPFDLSQRYIAYIPLGFGGGGIASRLKSEAQHHSY